VGRVDASAVDGPIVRLISPDAIATTTVNAIAFAR
jgi:hypothetical protein